MGQKRNAASSSKARKCIEVWLYSGESLDSKELSSLDNMQVTVRHFKTAKKLNDALSRLSLDLSDPGLSIRLDYAQLSVHGADGHEVELTKKEFRIFAVLYSSFPEPVCPKELRAKVWNGVQVIPKTLDVHLFRLRKKIEPLFLEVIFTSTQCYRLARRSAS